MYEWENQIDKNAVESNKTRIKNEIKRICDVTLRGNFANPEDRKYWESKLCKLTGQLACMESM